MQIDPGVSESIEPVLSEAKTEEKSQQSSFEQDLQKLARERETIERQLRLQEMIFGD